VIAKVEWHSRELYPRVGFIVTNMSRPAEWVVAFYNKRGTCEQWIKEGKARSSARRRQREYSVLHIESSRSRATLLNFGS
jgi:Transposase DDE domain group 1